MIRSLTTLTTLTALALLLSASPALASKTKYSGLWTGPDPLESGVSFKVVSKGDRPVSVAKFKYQVTVKCTGSDGEHALHTAPADSVPAMHVKKGKFSDTTTFQDQTDSLTYTVRGRIPGNGKPKGTIRVSGHYQSGGRVDCDMTVPWNARVDSGYDGT